MASGRDMQKAGDVLAGVIKGLNLGPRLAGWKAVDAWEDVVGGEEAGHARAVRFESGRLVVEVDSSARMARLGFEKPSLLERLNARAGEGVVHDLTFVMAGRPMKEGRRS